MSISRELLCYTNEGKGLRVQQLKVVSLLEANNLVAHP